VPEKHFLGLSAGETLPLILIKAHRFVWQRLVGRFLQPEVALSFYAAQTACLYDE
jgi:hypothetical protein